MRTIFKGECQKVMGGGRLNRRREKKIKRGREGDSQIPK